jgi:putative endonuclease
MSTRDVGLAAEDRAAQFLTSQGYRVIERNFRSKFGEIDLIAQDGETLVFVEVKARSSNLFGNPEDAVDHHKLEHIRKAGEYYVSLHANLPILHRIDVVSIEGESIKLIQVV